MEQLLTHTSGLTTADGLAHADRFDNEPGAVARQARRLGDVSLARDPGTNYEYSDLNYLLLGAIVEEIGTRSYAQEVTRVARGAGVDLVATPDAAAALPPGHRQVLGLPVAFDSDYDASGTPYGYLGADLDGVAAWARAQLGGRSLDATALATMHAGHVDTGSGDRYGQGWRVGELDGEPMIHHTGATPGYFAHVLLLPERGSAVVVLANSYSEARAPSLAALAQDVARLEDGAEPSQATNDGLLRLAPFVLGGLVVLGLAVASAVVVRPRRRRQLVALVAAVPLVALGLLAPRIIGYPSEQLRLWVPDIGWGLWAVVCAWAGVALIALAGLIRGWRRRGAVSLGLTADEGRPPGPRGRAEHHDGLAPVHVRDRHPH